MPLWIVAFCLLLAFCYFVSSLCITVIIAGFLAIVIEPLITRFERWHLHRMISAILVIVAGTALVGTLTYGSYQHISDAIDRLPLYAQRIEEVVAPISRKIQKLQKTAGKISVNVPSKRIPEVKVTSEYPDWTTYVIRGVGTVSGVIIIIAAVPFLTFFLLIQKNRFKQKLCIIWGDTLDVAEVAGNVTRMVRGFVVGNLIIGVLVASVTIVVLLALNVQGAVLLGCVSGFLNLVPFLGAIAGSIIPMAAALFQGESMSRILLILLTVVSLHAISFNLLIPRIIGRRVSLSPVAAMVGILFWGWLWGLIGVLLAVPLTASIKIVADSYPGLDKIGNLLAEKPQSVPPWSRAVTVHPKQSPTIMIKDRKQT